MYFSHISVATEMTMMMMMMMMMMMRVMTTIMLKKIDKFAFLFTVEQLKIEKIEICTILIPKGNSYCRRKKDCQQKLTYHYGHPSK